ncbi:MAG: hypothetical protein ACRDBY_14155 [Cetobacterium sp.]
MIKKDINVLVDEFAKGITEDELLQGFIHYSLQQTMEKNNEDVLEKLTILKLRTASEQLEGKEDLVIDCYYEENVITLEFTTVVDGNRVYGFKHNLEVVLENNENCYVSGSITKVE